MSTRPDSDLAIAAWLVDEARDGASDRLLAATRQQIESTHQRPSWWPARRLRGMNSFAKLAVAAAAVVAVALIGVSLLPGRGGVAAPGPSPTATPSPAPTASPQLFYNGPLDAGTVVTVADPIKLTFTVPVGWQAFEGSCLLPPAGTDAPDGMGICFLEVKTGLYSDPCHRGPVDVPVGPTVDDLVEALSQQSAYDSTAPVEATLGGYSGKRMDLQLPPDVSSCDNGEFYPWEGSIYAQGPSNRWRLWILDVEGYRSVIVSTDYAGTSEEDRAEQQAIIDSIQIQAAP
jgi:hypothetical protein